VQFNLSSNKDLLQNLPWLSSCEAREHLEQTSEFNHYTTVAFSLTIVQFKYIAWPATKTHSSAWQLQYGQHLRLAHKGNCACSLRFSFRETTACSWPGNCPAWYLLHPLPQRRAANPLSPLNLDFLSRCGPRQKNTLSFLPTEMISSPRSLLLIQDRDLPYRQPTHDDIHLYDFRLSRQTRKHTQNIKVGNALYFVILRSVRRLLVMTKVPSSPILVTLIMEALRSSETSVITRAIRRNVPEDAILHSHDRENFKSCNVLIVFRFSNQTSHIGIHCK
jgi:hypothetical protein